MKHLILTIRVAAMLGPESSGLHDPLVSFEEDGFIVRCQNNQHAMNQLADKLERGFRKRYEATKWPITQTKPRRESINRIMNRFNSQPDRYTCHNLSQFALI